MKQALLFFSTGRHVICYGILALCLFLLPPYFGPELSQSWARIDGASLFPEQDAIFSTNSITAEEWEINLSLFSVIGFFGLRYHFNSALCVGSS